MSLLSSVSAKPTLILTAKPDFIAEQNKGHDSRDGSPELSVRTNLQETHN